MLVLIDSEAIYFLAAQISAFSTALSSSVLSSSMRVCVRLSSTVCPSRYKAKQGLEHHMINAHRQPGKPDTSFHGSPAPGDTPAAAGYEAMGTPPVPTSGPRPKMKNPVGLQMN